MTASDWVANASLSSTAPMSSRARPLRQQRLLGRGDRAEPHDLGGDAGARAGDDAGARREAVALDRGLARDDDRRGAVVERRGVAGGDDRAAGDDGLQRGEHLERGVAARGLVDRDVALGGRHRDDLVGEVPGVDRGGGAHLAVVGEPVGVLAGDLVDAGDLLAGLRHAEGRLLAGDEARVREAPADRGVERGAGLAPRLVGLGLHPGRAGHRLDAAGDDQVGVAGADRLRGDRDRGHAGGAEAVDGESGDRVGQPGEQHGHPGDVAVVFAGLVRGAEDDLVERRSPACTASWMPARRTASATTSAARSSGRTLASAPP